MQPPLPLGFPPTPPGRAVGNVTPYLTVLTATMYECNIAR